MSAMQIKETLAGLIKELSASPWLFLKTPTKDFTRNRKISFSDTLSLLLSMEGKSTTNELLCYYQCSKDTPTASALRQQRDKIMPEAFEFLFREFSAACTSKGKCPLYNGYRLLAVDGSDLLFAANPSDPDSYYSGENGQKPHNIFHLNALFDLRQKVYVDAIVQKSRLANEHRALCDMVDRSSIDKAILLADRNYESYNDLAHLQEKGWKFLIRVKDGKCGIVSGLPLPEKDSFDCSFHLSLTRKQTNEVKKRMKEDPSLKYIATSTPFDFLPLRSRKHEPFVSYKLSFRAVRFRLTDSSFETVLTNLDPSEASPSMLKQLYALRWGIETSFRDLKYTVGLASFHSKKVDHVLQEIFARLTMYNFSELITACAVVRSVPGRNLAYQANFSAAVHICREFFRGNVHPPDVEAVISRFLSPVRPDRKRNRNLSPKGVVSFLYRVA